MNRVLVVCLLLQAVYAERNISISLGSPRESPADVRYVEGNAPEDLKAGPTKNSTKPREGILQAAFIHSSGREIPKDDEIENEEFERFIKKHHNRPTIETVFVSSSPSPLSDQEDSEEYNEESPRSQAEVFKRPAEYRTFERSIAHPSIPPSILSPSHHHTIDGHHSHFGDGISYGGGGNILVQGDGGQYTTFLDGQYVPGYGGGGQQYYQVNQGGGLVPKTFNFAQQGVKTKTFQIRRPAIQKHYYDIEERVIIRPAGSIVVELDRPVAKIPTGEIIVPVGGLQGGFGGSGFQQSQRAIGISQGGAQGGLSGIGIQQFQGAAGGSQGGFDGAGFQQSQGAIGVSQGGLSYLFEGPQGGLYYSTPGAPYLRPASPTPPFVIGGPQGGFAGVGIQQAQGSGAQGGFQQGQQGIGISQTGTEGGLTGVGIQQAQEGGAQGGFQQGQQGIGISQVGPQGGLAGVGIQQGQGGGTQGGVQQGQQGIGISQVGPQGGLAGEGIQQGQGGGTQGGVQQGQQGIGISQTGPQGGIAGVGIQQGQGGGTQGGVQQGKQGIGKSQTGPQGGIAGVGIQQGQGGGTQGGVQQGQQGVGISQTGPQGGIAGVGIQQGQGGGAQGGFPQGQQGIGISQTGPQGGIAGVGIQQGQGGGAQGGIQQGQQGVGISQAGPQGGIAGVGIQQGQGGGAQGGIPQGQQGIGISQTGPQGGIAGVGLQQGQGGFGGAQGGFPGVGIQQGQQGISISQAGSQRGLGGVGIQQAQGASGVQQGGAQGGIFGGGFQQSQGGVSSSTTPATSTSINIGGSQGGLFYSTTGAAYLPPAAPTPQNAAGGAQGGLVGSGFQQSQGAIGISQGGAQGGLAGVGIQQSQGPIGVGQVGSQGGIPGLGVSQGGAPGGLAGTGISFSTTAGTPTVSVTIGGTQGGVSYSTTGAFLPPISPTPTVFIGGSQGGAGSQQSQGAIGISQDRAQGGLAGVGIQQSQGAIGVGQGGSQAGIAGAGFQQSQGAIGVGQAGPQGGLAGVGIQQSQGAIGVGQAGPQGGLAGVGIQQSQGALGVSQGGNSGAGFQQSQGGIYSTTFGPYLPPITPTPSFSILGQRGGYIGPSFQQYVLPGYPTSTITATPTQQTNNDDSVVVEARSNVQNRGSFASTTTTERSFSSSVSQDASTYATGSASGSVQEVSKKITPYMITVGEPDFHYPPYVEINSHGSPLGHLVQQPYAQVQATSPPYPRMRYQGRLLTGEVHTDDLGRQQQYSGYGALARNIVQQHSYESPAFVVEVPPNTPEEVQSTNEQQANTHHHRQYVGSSQKLPQVSQISGSGHQQPAQVHQHHFVTSTTRPIEIVEVRSGSQEQQHQSNRQHVAEVTQQPIHVTQYRSRTHQPAPVYEESQRPAHAAQIVEQHDAKVNQQPIHSAQYHSRAHQRPNLVAQIRHQQGSHQPAQVETQGHQQHIGKSSEQIQNSIPEQHVVEVTSQPIEVSDDHSSTHRQYLQQHRSFSSQQQVASTTQQPEPLASGHRLYQQRPAPQKYTQHHTINVAPSQHTIFFGNQPQQLQHSGKSQKLVISSEPETNDEDPSVRTTSFASSTAEALTSSTTIAPTPRQAEDKPRHQQQTYASVLANSKPGILYASPGHTVTHHSQRNPQFNSEGSSLFSPSGRQLHLVYSQPSHVAYSQQTRSNLPPPVPALKSGEHHISLSNKGLDAQIPITHHRQIQLSASRNSASAASESQASSTAARYEAISSTNPSTISSTDQAHIKGRQKYRNEQTRGALTLRSGRTYADHRVIASTPAPSDGGAASESVQTRRIVVNHPFQTVQEIVEREPITKFQQVTVNEPATPASQASQTSHDDLQQDQQKASFRRPAAYKLAATYNHPAASLSYHQSGSH